MFAEKLECKVRLAICQQQKQWQYVFFAKWSGSKHFSHRVIDQSLGLYTLRD